MIINEIPEVVTFDDFDEDTMEVVPVVATVLFISPKYKQDEAGNGEDNFAVICYDSDNVVYEMPLNAVKIIKTKKYDKNRSPRDSFGKRKRKRAGNKQRNNNSDDKENNPQEGESEDGRKGNPGKAYGGKAGGKGIL